jgi:hypothetical protein
VKGPPDFRGNRQSAECQRELVAPHNRLAADDVTTSAGLQSQITASIRVTAIGRFLRTCSLYGRRDEQMNKTAIRRFCVPIFNSGSRAQTQARPEASTTCETEARPSQKRKKRRRIIGGGV